MRARAATSHEIDISRVVVGGSWPQRLLCRGELLTNCKGAALASIKERLEVVILPWTRRGLNIHNGFDVWLSKLIIMISCRLRMQRVCTPTTILTNPLADALR